MTSPRIYAFDRFTLHTESRTLYRSGEPVRLAPKVFSTLLYLIERPNQIVIKEELINAVWGGTKVETGGIARNISALRAALNDSEDTRYIVTVAKRGYKFCANVYDVTATTNRAGITTNRNDTLTTQNGLRSGNAPTRLAWLSKLAGGSTPS